MTTKIKFPWVAAFFPVALIALTLIRFFQYTNVINPQTGFFEHDGGFLNHAYYAGLAVMAVGLLVLNLLDKRAARGILGGKPANPNFGLPFALVGALPAMLCAGSLFPFSFSAGEAQQLETIPLILTILAALGFSFAGYSFIAHRKLLPLVALAFLFMAAYFAGESALEFMERSYTANLTTRLVILSVSLLMAIFLLSAGRIVVKSETKFTIYTATLSGYLLIALIISDFTARLLYYFTAEETLQDTLTTYAATSGFELPSPMFIAQGILVGWLLFALTIRGNQSEENEETDKLEELLKGELTEDVKPEVENNGTPGIGSDADSDTVNPDELLS